MKTRIEKLFVIIDKYLTERNTTSLALEYQSPKDLEKHFSIGENCESESDEDLFNSISKYLKYCVNTANPQFFNQLYAGFNWPAFAGDVATSLTNTSMYTYEVAPVATVLELALIEKMCRYAGYTDGDGILVTGGSNANLIAMFSARNRIYPEGKRSGLRNGPELAAFVSDQSHYSFGTAANILGIGADHVLKVPSDPAGKMIPAALESIVVASSERGQTPFFVAATAGTTLLGAYDPIDQLSVVCTRHGLWLHVDGSFGGSAILSQRHRDLFAGIEEADSFAWNPHKLMNIPLVCSAILVKEKGMLHRNLSLEGADYIFHDTDTQHYDLGKKSAQCGRRVDALKLWLAWKYYGDDGYARRIDKLFDLADYLGSAIEKNDRLELMAPVQSFTVCFRYRCENTADNNGLNYTLRENLRKRGTSIVNYGFMGEELTIRFVVVNPDVEESDIDQFLVNVLEEGDRLATGAYSGNSELQD